MHAVKKKQPNASVVVSRKADVSVKPFKAQKDVFVLPTEIAHCNHSSGKGEVSESDRIVEFVKRKKRKRRPSCMSSDNDRTCAITADVQCSSVTEPRVELKSVAKRVRTAEKSLKSRCSDKANDSTSLCVAPRCLLVDSAVPSKRRKVMRDNKEVDSVVKTSDIKAHNGRQTDEVHAAAGERSICPRKHNFDIVKLRSALQQSGRLADQQAGLCSKSTFKKKSLQKQEDATTAAESREGVDVNSSATGESSFRSEKTSAGSLSGLLKERVLNRLASGRFRFINEKMYRSTGSEAAEMFANDRDAFAVYHAGFQAQVSKWPMNPVDRMIDYISNRFLFCVDLHFKLTFFLDLLNSKILHVSCQSLEVVFETKVFSRNILRTK